MVTLPDGRRRRLKTPFKAGTSEAYARERTAFIAEQIRTGALVFADIEEQDEQAAAASAECATWVNHWHKDRAPRLASASRSLERRSV
jgi:hypothetical protein